MWAFLPFLAWEAPDGTSRTDVALPIAVGHVAATANDQEIRFAWLHHSKER
jgi:hypothetical protein